MQGLLQFIATWEESIPINGKAYKYTRVTYFEAFRLAFTPTPNEIIYPARYTTLLYFSSDYPHYFVFKTTSDSRLLFHQAGYQRPGVYEVTFGVSQLVNFIFKHLNSIIISVLIFLIIVDL